MCEMMDNNAKDNSVIYSAKFLDKEQFFKGVIPRIDIKPFLNAHMSREVIVCKDNEPVIVLCIFIEIDSGGFLLEQCFSELLVNDRHIAILYGQHIHIFDIASRQVKSFFLNDYVGHIYPVPDVFSEVLSDNFLVTTFEYTFLINIESGIVWKSARCAIDGVIIHSIEGNVISGSGEWDPPGGWKPFSLQLSDGHFINP